VPEGCVRIDLVRDAAAAAHLPEVIGERCVHSLIERATCRRCVDACPTGAWLIDEERLGIDPARCDGCGLCAPACPQAAIVARTAEPLLVSPAGGSAAPGANRPEAGLLPGGRSMAGGSAAPGAITAGSGANVHNPAAMLACDRAWSDGRNAVLGGSAAPGAMTAGSGATGGIVPCIHALGPRDLARLAAAGCGRLIVATGDCNACPRGSVVRLESRLADLARLLDSRGLRVLRLERLPPDRWLVARAAAAPDAGPAMGRRSFLRRGLGLAVDQAASAFGLGAAEREGVETVARLLPDTARPCALAPVAPRIDPAACTGCDACVRLCPQQAVRLERVEAADPAGDGERVDAGAAWVPAERPPGVERERLTEGKRVTSGLAYRLTPSDCTGCGICVDVCADDAVHLEPWAPAAPIDVPLAEATCARCRVRFHRPLIDLAEGPAHCPICARRTGTDRLFRVQE
jgi:ferredoxin